MGRLQLALAKVPWLSCLGRLERRGTAPMEYLIRAASSGGVTVLTDVIILTAPVTVFYSGDGHRLRREGSAIALTALIVWLRVYSDYKVVLEPFLLLLLRMKQQNTIDS